MKFSGPWSPIRAERFDHQELLDFFFPDISMSLRYYGKHRTEESIKKQAKMICFFCCNSEEPDTPDGKHNCKNFSIA